MQARRQTAERSRLGQVLSGRYQLLDLLGVGGMGAVYKCHDSELDRFVAVKMLLADIAEDDSMVERFIREAKLSGRINHPNVVRLEDYGTSSEGFPYIVMEYLAGTNLARLIKENGQIGILRTLDIFVQVCDALTAAHRKNIIHRDLKPSNIMLVETDGEKDFVKVLDFGLARQASDQSESQRLTQTGEILGSPVYMSPEQCFGGALDARSDIYSLAIVIYEALSGQLPFFGNSIAETITKQLNQMPKPFAEIRPDLHIPEKIEAVVFHALAKAPEQRPASMEEFKEELLLAMPGRGVMSSPIKVSSGRTGELRKVNSGEVRKAVAGELPKISPFAVSVSKPVVIAAVAVLVIACLCFFFKSTGPEDSPPKAVHSQRSTTPVFKSPPIRELVKTAAELPIHKTARVLIVPPKHITVQANSRYKKNTDAPIAVKRLPTISTPEIPLQPTNRRSRSRSRSHEDTFYEYQAEREGKYSRPSTWTPAVQGQESTFIKPD